MISSITKPMNQYYYRFILFKHTDMERLFGTGRPKERLSIARKQAFYLNDIDFFYYRNKANAHKAANPGIPNMANNNPEAIFTGK